jgi:hypothetical protein
MRNVKAKKVPIITGATGGLSPSLQEYLHDTPGHHSGVELQESVTLETANIFMTRFLKRYVLSPVGSSSFQKRFPEDAM